MGKNPTCNYATSVYSLFRNKLLLCYISIKIPCVELRERRRSNNLHTLYDIQGHYMHFDASFYLNRHIHVRYINHNFTWVLTLDIQTLLQCFLRIHRSTGLSIHLCNSRI